MKITYTSYHKAGECPFDDATLAQLRRYHWQIQTLLREPRASELDNEFCFLASKDFYTPGEGILEFQALTGLDVVAKTAPNDLGGSFFAFGDGTYCYGEGCKKYINERLNIKDLQDAAAQLYVCRKENQGLKRRIADLEKALQSSRGAPKDRRKRSDEPLAG